MDHMGTVFWTLFWKDGKYTVVMEMEVSKNWHLCY